ncbi:MAG: hypothetical protein K8823_1178 [Cenarchaeum symbiont of Oopsacas minuta]|nr:restriction endonuclease [Cenarchaeum symbiont of Oopsacas minuta]MDI1495870.1 hypothetical protein [Cenarchaeum symbiont of Oopsacas minuta]
MNILDVNAYKKTFRDNAKTLMVFEVLEDREWHCRTCEYDHVGSTQIAGSGGIQGLQRGSTNRDGLEIDSKNNLCANCKKRTMHDKWSGNAKPKVTGGSLSNPVQQKVLELYNYKDVVEQIKRSANELTIDHRFPRLRWTDGYGDADMKTDMSIEDIKKRFQLLKKSNGTASHNHLKSRACEKCFEENKRGSPFGIKFYYNGDENWEGENLKDENGCHGCGWYDFNKWRKALNKFIIDKK